MNGRALGLGLLLCLTMVLASVLASSAAAITVTSQANTALIDGDSVTTSDGLTRGETAVSLEQWAAENAGYTVTVKSGAEWEAMSAAEFAQYQVLIVGDPFCGSTSVAADNSAPTWTPVVMGTSGLNPTVGNRAVIGTDPEFHYLEGGGGATPRVSGEPASAGAEHLVQDGIDLRRRSGRGDGRVLRHELHGPRRTGSRTGNRRPAAREAVHDGAGRT